MEKENCTQDRELSFKTSVEDYRIEYKETYIDLLKRSVISVSMNGNEHFLWPPLILLLPHPNPNPEPVSKYKKKSITV